MSRDGVVWMRGKDTKRQAAFQQLRTTPRRCQTNEPTNQFKPDSKTNLIKKPLSQQQQTKQVYLASASPPVKFPNVYGVDMPSKREFVANGLTDAQVRVRFRALCCMCVLRGEGRFLLTRSLRRCRR